MTQYDVVGFAKMLSFLSYGWLTVMAFLDTSEDKTTHSWLPRHLQVWSVLQDSFGSAERSSEKPISIVSKPTPPSCNVLAWNSRSRPAVYAALACFLVN